MSLDALCKALKAANLTQGGGKRILDENPMNLSQGGGSMVETSPDQKAKKRKNSECGKRVKKRKLKKVVRLLHAIGEDNQQIESENKFTIQKLQLVQDKIEQQKAEYCVSQNKIITAQENILQTLCQEPFAQHLMVGSNQFEVAAQCAVSSPNADLDGIVELKHRNMVLGVQTERFCKMIINNKPK